jgi:hypothetical protein
MTDDQASKLLGGYATGSLTEAERKMLFEAALEDQELFDALQQEQALKELLADPASRNQIQRALAQTPPPRPSPAWWSRRWAWAGVAGAVAATVLTVAVIRLNQPHYEVARIVQAPAAPVQQQPLPAPSERAAPSTSTSKPRISRPSRPMRPRKQEAAPPAATAGSLSDDKVQSQAASVPPPLPAPAPAVAPRMQAMQAASGAPPAAGVGGFVSNLAATASRLRYSILKRDAEGAYAPSLTGLALQPGDAIRFNVVSALPGYLSLYQQDAAGAWKLLFPVTAPGLLVSPNTADTVPDSPIVVTDMVQRFRLTLIPVPENKDAAAPLKEAPAPLNLDIAIAPGKVP